MCKIFVTIFINILRIFAIFCVISFLFIQSSTASELQYDDITTITLTKNNYKFLDLDQKAIKIIFKTKAGSFWCYVFKNRTSDNTLKMLKDGSPVKFDMKIESVCGPGLCGTDDSLYIGQLISEYGPINQNTQLDIQQKAKNDRMKATTSIDPCGDMQKQRKNLDRKDLTEMQRKILADEFDSKYYNKNIMWKMKVVDVKEIQANMLNFVFGQPDSGIEIKLIGDCGNHAVLILNDNYRKISSTLSKGDTINFSGRISSARGSLFTSDSTIIINQGNILSVEPNN